RGVQEDRRTHPGDRVGGVVVDDDALRVVLVDVVRELLAAAVIRLLPRVVRAARLIDPAGAVGDLAVPGARARVPGAETGAEGVDAGGTAAVALTLGSLGSEALAADPGVDGEVHRVAVPRAHALGQRRVGAAVVVREGEGDPLRCALEAVHASVGDGLAGCGTTRGCGRGGARGGRGGTGGGGCGEGGGSDRDGRGCDAGERLHAHDRRGGGPPSHVDEEASPVVSAGCPRGRPSAWASGCAASGRCASPGTSPGPGCSCPRRSGRGAASWCASTAGRCR